MDSTDQLDKNEQVMQYLMKLCEKYGYRVIQANGQRIYSPPESMEIPVPPKGSEIFIGKLRKDMFEDEIIPVLEQIAQLYKFRLMLDYTGRNRGFAFATYYNPEYAQKAIKEFDNYEIRPNVRIGVCRSVDNCTLYIGNLPRDKFKSDIFDLMADASDDVVNVVLHSDQVNKHLNRGYAFVEFKDHRSAAIVRRRFTPKNLYAWDRFLSVDWAEPEPEVDPHIMENVKILIIKQLPYEITTKDLSERIYEYLDKLLIDKVSKTEDFAFVHFITREAAEIGLDLLKTHLKYQGCNIEIEFSKPPEYSKGHRVAAVEPNNFCLSVPPSIRRKVLQNRFNQSTPRF